MVHQPFDDNSSHTDSDKTVNNHAIDMYIFNFFYFFPILMLLIQTSYSHCSIHQPLTFGALVASLLRC